MKRLLAALLLASLAACSDDGPAGPEPVDAVFILLNNASPIEHTLRVGQTVQLTARVADRAGTTLTGRPVTWTSTNQSVATVDANGLVTAVGTGPTGTATTQIIAASEGKQDAVTINVVAPPPSSISCPAGAAGLDLDVGEVFTTTAAETGTICVNGGGVGSEYTYIPYHASSVGADTLRFQVRSSEVTTASGPPNPSRGPVFSRVPGGFGPRLDDDFHLRMMRAAREMYPRARSATQQRPTYSRALAAVPAVGSRIDLNASTESCANADLRVGTVEAVTERAVIVADTSNPAGGFTRAEYRSFGVTFDTLIYEVNTENFGELPSDLDDNDRIIVFFTKAVNDLTNEGDDSFIGGFHHPRDVFPRSGPDGCAASNEAEMFYMMVPDPARGGPFEKEDVLETTTGVLAHEYQHLVNFAGRLARGAESAEETWLDEGISHIAEELIFYEAAGLEPRLNLDVDAIRASERRRSAFNTYASSNFDRLIRYLEQPQQESLMAAEDNLATRGAAWAFLRYAADRLPGDDTPLWRSLVQTRAIGVSNLRLALGQANDPFKWIQDWTVSVYTDDAPIGTGDLPVDPEYTQPSWDYRAIYEGLGQVARYPLRTIALANDQGRPVDLALLGGGTAFLRFGIAGSGQAAISATSGGVPAPERLRISIVRTK